MVAPEDHQYSCTGLRWWLYTCRHRLCHSLPQGGAAQQEVCLRSSCPSTLSASCSLLPSPYIMWGLITNKTNEQELCVSYCSCTGFTASLLTQHLTEVEEVTKSFSELNVLIWCWENTALWVKVLSTTCTSYEGELLWEHQVMETLKIGDVRFSIHMSKCTRTL